VSDVAVAAVPAFFWSWIVPLALQGLILLAAAGIADRLLPKSVWPELRLAAGTILLLKLLLPPRVASPIPWTHPLAGWMGSIGTGSATADAPGSLRLWAIAAGWIWLAGVLAGLVFLLIAARRLRREWRQAEPAPAEVMDACMSAARKVGLARVPPVRLLPGISTPFVFGVMSPGILLPADIRPDEVEHALLHELSHVRRGDLVLAGLVGLVRTLYWFHPFVHAAAGRLTDLRELCCDRSVARRLGAATTQYRRTLLSFAARRHHEALAALPMTGGSSLLIRLRALEMIERDRPWLRRGLTLGAAVVTLACALPLAPVVERRAAAVAELVTRPPGCLQLRYLVMRRLAEEQRGQSPSLPENP
jgi:beta-lactamase regulating signal transducer with metallopeptidase domain